MSAPFLDAIQITPLGEGRYRSRFEAPWYQGRGAFGGVVAGQILRAMEHVVADPGRTVRSFTVHFCAPASEGEAELSVRIECVFRRSRTPVPDQADHRFRQADHRFRASRSPA